MTEVWKDVKNYETHSEISSHGRLRSKARHTPCRGGATRFIKEKPKKLFVSRTGYLISTLSMNSVLTTFTIHQLVAQAFIPDFVLGTEINHKDGVKTNNNIENLEISNPSHNQLHAVTMGLVPKNSVSIYRNVTFVKNPRAKAKWAGSIRHNDKSTYGWKTFMTEIEAARHVDALLDSIGDTQRVRNFPPTP